MRETTSIARERQAQRHLRVLKTRDTEIWRLRGLMTRALELLVMATDLLEGHELTPELRQEALKLMLDVRTYAQKHMGNCETP